ncbi:FxLYD domain-containing protein [Natrinema pellirubrum]|nr:FxLYD domain-containing protein [Natrinema pellirubrum]
MDRRTYLTTTAGVIGAVGLAGCSGDEGDFEGGNGNGNGNGNNGSSNDVELLNHELVRENEGGMAETVSVDGEAENVSGSELSYAEVEVKFYEGDTLADSFLDNVNNLGAGETWAFSVQYTGMGEDAAAITDYEIRAGTSL